jgi:hypothetical protein
MRCAICGLPVTTWRTTKDAEGRRVHHKCPDWTEAEIVVVKRAHDES